jgi:competence protein ComEC
MIIDIFAASLAAIVAVWPLIAYNFGIVSLVGLPATFFSLPALPFIIVTTALVAFVGLLASLVAQVLGWLAWLFLSYLVFIVQGFDALPYASLEATAISVWYVLGYYAILAGVIAFLNHRTKLADFFSGLTSRIKKIAEDIPKPRLGFSPKWLVLPLLVVVILVWSIALTMPDDKLRVSFLDVGQGDAILIQKGNQQVLIDGGPSPQAISLGLGNKMPFWDRTIELVILTHPSADHVTGLVEVLHRYKVKQVLYPDLDYRSDIYDEWLKLLKEKDIKSAIAQAGQQIDLGEVVIKVLNPQIPLLTGTESDIDNNSVVLSLRLGDVSFLLTADIMWEAEFELIARRANLHSTVLKVAHHGSRTSTTSQFLAAVDPEAALISVGADNPFGHPNPEVLARLVDRLGEDDVYRTDEDGTIRFITDGERLWVKTDG